MDLTSGTTENVLIPRCEFYAHDMADAKDPGIVEGLAAIATSVAEMGGTDDDIRAGVANMMLQLHIADHEVVDVLRAVVASISKMPQPMTESAEKTERRRHVREMLGVQSAEEQLLAMMRAREVVQQLADRLESEA